MNESDLGKGPTVNIGKTVEIAEIERVIAHMEADISFHHSQTRMFEKLIQSEQKKLELLIDECSQSEDEVNGA
jgi:hypothetical protein